MTPETAVKLEAAKAHAAELRLLTDRLNAMLVEAEQALIAINLGVPGWVALELNISLRFMKGGGSWGLYVLSEGHSREQLTPILKASRRLRSASASALGSLLDDLISRTCLEKEEVQRGIRDADQFLDRIRPDGANQ